MNDKNNPLRINIGLLLNQTIGYYREFNFEIPVKEISPDLVLRELKGVSRINRTPQGLLVNGEFGAYVELECVRCLDKYRHSLKTTFDELYAFTEKTVTDSGLILPEDGYIDLQPIVNEYLLIEIPIKPLCKQDCLGLCTICGINRNRSTCSHEEVTKKISKAI